MIASILYEVEFPKQYSEIIWNIEMPELTYLDKTTIVKNNLPRWEDGLEASPQGVTNNTLDCVRQHHDHGNLGCLLVSPIQGFSCLIIGTPIFPESWVLNSSILHHRSQNHQLSTLDYLFYQHLNLSIPKPLIQEVFLEVMGWHWKLLAPLLNRTRNRPKMSPKSTISGPILPVVGPKSPNYL